MKECFQAMSFSISTIVCFPGNALGLVITRISWETDSAIVSMGLSNICFVCYYLVPLSSIFQIPPVEYPKLCIKL